jgi:hypothetical protein
VICTYAVARAASRMTLRPSAPRPVREAHAAGQELAAAQANYNEIEEMLAGASARDQASEAKRIYGAAQSVLVREARASARSGAIARSASPAGPKQTGPGRPPVCPRS